MKLTEYEIKGVQHNGRTVPQGTHLDYDVMPANLLDEPVKMVESQHEVGSGGHGATFDVVVFDSGLRVDAHKFRRLVEEHSQAVVRDRAKEFCMRYLGSC